MAVYLLMSQTTCQDDYYPDYTTPVWMGAEPPTETEIDRVWALVEGDSPSAQLVLLQGSGDVDADTATPVRPRPSIEWDVFATWSDGDSIGRVRARTWAEAIEEATADLLTPEELERVAPAATEE